MNQLQGFSKDNSQPIFRWTIARKIGGLSSILILFILVIIIYSIDSLRKIRADLQEIAQLDVPLTEIASSIEIQQLEQQIKLDQLLRLSQKDSNIENKKLALSKQKIINYSTKLEQDIERGIALSKKGMNPESQATFEAVNKSLIALKKESISINDIVSDIVKVFNNKDYPDSEILDRLLQADEQFNRHAIDFIKAIEDFTARRLVMAEKHEHTFYLVNIALGIAAVFLGILLSLIIIISIKTNLFQLSKKMLEVRQAIAENKSLSSSSTTIKASDEIGDLAIEISQTIENFSEEIEQRERLAQHLKEIATTDRLTGAFNRLKWEETLTDEIDRTQRSKQDLSVIIFDIDFFKKVNDTYGHDVGDIVLIEVVKIAKQEIRKTDSLYRIGGEEFTVLAPYTKCDRVLVLAERIRKAIENNTFKEVEHITISMGVTQFQESEDPKLFIKRADLALYKSKEGGRNQVNVL